MFQLLEGLTGILHLAPQGIDRTGAGIDAAVARAEATGSEVGIDVYRDALVAGAEGMQAVNKALDTQYDSRYALVQLI